MSLATREQKAVVTDFCVCLINDVALVTLVQHPMDNIVLLYSFRC